MSDLIPSTSQASDGNHGNAAVAVNQADQVIQIKYGAQSAVSRWFERYWSPRDRRAFPWLIFFILVFFGFKGPMLLTIVTSFLPLDQLGQSGASILNHNILLAVSALLAGSAVALAAIPLSKPSLIETSAQGIRLIWTFGLFSRKGPLLPWSKIKSVRLSRPSNTTDPRKYQICFAEEHAAPALGLEVGQLEGDETKDTLLSAIARGAAQANIESEVFEALAPKRQLSFTELWLDALSAPPNRERLLPLSEGTLIDSRFKINKRLGSGGQGTVYLAEDADGNKTVVLKETILPVYTDLASRRQALEDFHKEAHALESVKHPNIVSFLGSVVADHRAYLVLEHINGRTLRDVVASTGPLDAKRSVKLAAQMCDILSVLHGLTPPMVHRDFTPDNLIVDDNDKLTLLDFAVAVVGDRASSDVAGKASYMAPEQFKGNPTPQSDLYSAGCTLSFLLTGEHPDPLTESHPIVANKTVPKALSDVVARATKYVASERYLSVAEFKADLELDV